MVLVPLGSGSGFGACLPFAFVLLFSGVISWFFLVPARVPVLNTISLQKVGQNWATDKCRACQLQHLFDATPEPSLL